MLSSARVSEADHGDTLSARLGQLFSGGLIPHNVALAMSAVRAEPGLAVLKLPYAAHLAGDPETGVLHGGVVTSLLDAAGGLAAMLRMPQNMRVATLELRIDYLRAAVPGRDLFARAECYRYTRSIAFVRGVAYHAQPDSSDLEVAAAAATFMIFGHDGDGPTSVAP